MDVAVIDYGTGNLHTLVRALQEAGAAVRLEADLNAALQAGALVLPATGAFGAAASRLATGTVALHQALLNGKPCLAIGLGMHLLFESSSEDEGAGLCVFAGSVEFIRVMSRESGDDAAMKARMYDVMNQTWGGLPTKSV